MFASPGPIYEPGDNNDFWNMSRTHSAGLRKRHSLQYFLIPPRSCGLMFIKLVTIWAVL